MRTISRLLKNRQAIAAPAKSVRLLGEAELDQVAAAGGAGTGGVGSGSGGARPLLTRPPDSRRAASQP